MLPVNSCYGANEGYVGAFPTNYNPENPKTKSWFIYELKPGKSMDDSITLVNNSEKPINVRVYPVDATTTSDGAFALLNESQEQTGVGSWVKMSKTLLTLEPKSATPVPFTIRIPRQTIVGDHAGGIIVQEVENLKEASSGIGLNIVSRVGTRIYQTVPGDKVFKMEIRDFAYKIVEEKLEYSFVLENLGNVILNPTGRVELKDQTGKIVETIYLNNLGSVFPGKPTQNTAKATQSRPMIGEYTATVIVNYTTTKDVSKSITFFLFFNNWEYVIPAGLILFLIILFFVIRKRLSHHIRRAGARFGPIQPAYHPLPGKAVYRPLETHFSSAPAPAAAPSANVDQLFLIKHLKLIIFLIPTSIVMLSGIFAVILYLFAMSTTGGFSNQTTLIAPASTEKERAVDEKVYKPEPTPIPSPAEALEEIDKSKIQIEVLNGSGIPGAAKIIADKLSGEGFSVARIDNAFDDTLQTIVKYPAGQVESAKMLKELLKPEYSEIVLEEVRGTDLFTIILVI